MILQSDVFRIFFSFVKIHGKYFQPHPSGIAASMDDTGTLGPVLPLPGGTVTPCGKWAEPVRSVPSVSFRSAFCFLTPRECHCRDSSPAHRRASSDCHPSPIRHFHCWKTCLMSTLILRYREYSAPDGQMLVEGEHRNWEKKKILHFNLNWCYRNTLLFIIIHTAFL